MIKVLFVCMGNICRSPAAEGIFKKIVKESKLEDQIEVDSAGTIGYHEGELPDTRMRKHALKRGYNLDSFARRFNSKKDFDEFDYIITMDDDNYAEIIRSDYNKIEGVLKEKITNHNSVSGGCINDARVLLTESGKHFFIKTCHNNPPDMFAKEANGLKELASANAIRIPEVISVNDNFLLLEAIIPSPKSKFFFEDFGRRFAKLHKHHEKYFGFYENNYIGSTPQINIADENEKSDWIKFYFNKRLKFQFDLAEKNGYAGEELRKAFSKLENKIDDSLKSNDEKPSLLHGDLWSGNYITDENGSACIIDPAVYCGHREADLAMTKLFGGFDNKFYAAYNEEYPLDDGYLYRENIYKLYHVLNHLNLFGSGYYQQAVSLIKYYL